jgi:hypothetical protein
LCPLLQLKSQSTSLQNDWAQLDDTTTEAGLFGLGLAGITMTELASGQRHVRELNLSGKQITGSSAWWPHRPDSKLISAFFIF